MSLLCLLLTGIDGSLGASLFIFWPLFRWIWGIFRSLPRAVLHLCQWDANGGSRANRDRPKNTSIRPGLLNSTFTYQQQHLKYNKPVNFSNDHYLIFVKDGPVELLPFLYLGSAFHSSRRETLTAAGITAVLNVSSTCPNFFEGEFQYLQLTVEDSLATDIRACFSTAIAFIGEILLKPTAPA